MSSSSTSIKSIMFFFKTSGYTGGTISSTVFTIKANGKFYRLRFRPITGKPNKNSISVFVNTTLSATPLLETEKKKSVNLYQNKILAPFDNFEFDLNQWTFIILEFLNPLAAADSYFEITNGTAGVVTNVSNFSYYSLNAAEQVQYVNYNTWGDIDNVNWYNYTSNSLTWANVFATITNSRSSGSVTDIWNSYFGLSTVLPTNNATIAETVDDIIPLQFGNYEYKTYQDIVKVSKIQSPI